jgi:hypothetical protein
LIIDHSLIIFYKNKTTQMARKWVPNTLVTIRVSLTSSFVETHNALLAHVYIDFWVRAMSIVAIAKINFEH